MELANCILALGGDTQNTVPKFAVTPAEVALLLAIHGDQAISEIEVVGEVERRNTEEADRLLAQYPAKDESGNLILQQVYPGRQPILHQTFADLQLPDEFFAVKSRAVPAEAPAKKTKAKAAEPKPEPLNIKLNDATDLFDDEDETVMN